MLLQLPWAIRSFHEVEAALAWERPDVLVLYAEYSGLGRAAIAAAARVGVVSFAVQHGILYPRLYGAEHSAEEVGPAVDGRDCVPIPTRTAVFGSMYRCFGKVPSEVSKEHSWRTREDPFAEIWEEVRSKLDVNSGLQAKTLFKDLQRRHPGEYQDGQLRTL